MAKLTQEQIKERVFKNSLETCEYIDGYENAQSTIKVKCIKHDYEFETKWENVRRDNRKHYICPLCQQNSKEKENFKDRVEFECAYCHKKFMRPKSRLDKSKSGLYFCCREHKDLAQRIESGDKFQAIRPDHYNNGIFNYRIKALRSYPNECHICKWNEDIDILEVHHIDENRNNNDIDNLMILCPLCHKKLTTHKYILSDDRCSILKKE